MNPPHDYTFGVSPQTSLPDLLQAQACRKLVVEHGSDSPAKKVAQAHGLMILELCPEPEAPAGVFRLTGAKGFSSARPDYGQPEDVALVLHTSGTIGGGNAKDYRT